MTRGLPLHLLPPVFLGSAAVRDDLLTSSQLRSRSFVRVLRGVYRHASVPLTHALVCEAAALLIPPTAMVTGRSAATLLGLDLAGPRDPVEVLVDERRPFGPYRGLLVRRAVRMPRAARTIGCVPVAPPLRMAFDLAARHSLSMGVAHLDAAARAGLVDLEQLSPWLTDQHCPDVVAVRAACALTDPRAESVPESVVRVLLTQDGLDVVPQYEVLHHGRLVARVDLALVALRIAIEYDGAWHVLREQLQADRRRLNDLQAAGWTVVHVTASMLHRPEQIAGAVRDAMWARSGRPDMADRGLSAV